MTLMFRFLHKRKRQVTNPIWSSHDGKLMRYSRSWTTVLDEYDQMSELKRGYIEAMHDFAPVGPSFSTLILSEKGRFGASLFV